MSSRNDCVDFQSDCLHQHIHKENIRTCIVKFHSFFLNQSIGLVLILFRQVGQSKPGLKGISADTEEPGGANQPRSPYVEGEYPWAQAK